MISFREEPDARHSEQNEHSPRDRIACMCSRSARSKGRGSAKFSGAARSRTSIRARPLNSFARRRSTRAVTSDALLLTRYVSRRAGICRFFLAGKLSALTGTIKAERANFSRTQHKRLRPVPTDPLFPRIPLLCCSFSPPQYQRETARRVPAHRAESCLPHRSA